MPQLTEAYLNKLTGSYDLEVVKRLDLSNKQLKSLQGVELCPNLVELNISNNLLHDLEPVAALKELTRLDASNNHIRKLIVGLGTLVELTHLRLENNSVSSMDELRVLSNLPKLKNFYLQNKKVDEKENKNEEKSKQDGSNKGGGGGGGGDNPVCDHPAYTTTLLRYAPDLQVLDGERIQLRESSQQAMLAAMATPAEKLEIPDRERWLEGYSWDTSDVKGTAAAGRKKKPRPGQQAVTSDQGPVPWTSMFSEEFVDAATNDQTLKFEKGIQEGKKLDEEADMLLKSCTGK